MTWGAEGASSMLRFFPLFDCCGASSTRYVLDMSSSLSLCHFPLHILCLLLAIRCMFHLCNVWTNSCTFEPTWVSKSNFSVFCDDFGVVVSKRGNSEREVANWQRGPIRYSLLVSLLENVSTACEHLVFDSYILSADVCLPVQMISDVLVGPW